DRSDRILAATGQRPRVFLANLGTAAEFNTRATFATNFFAAGGIEAVTNDGFADQAAMLDAFKSSGARRACLCGTDTAYAAQASAVATALRAAGADPIYVAGRWDETALPVHPIHAGCNAL